MIMGSSTYKQTCIIYKYVCKQVSYLCICMQRVDRMLGTEILVQFMLLYSFTLYSE